MSSNRKPTASPQQIRSKLHATISKSYSKSHNLFYNNQQLIEVTASDA